MIYVRSIDTHGEAAYARTLIDGRSRYAVAHSRAMRQEIVLELTDT